MLLLLDEYPYPSSHYILCSCTSTTLTLTLALTLTTRSLGNRSLNTLTKPTRTSRLQAGNMLNDSKPQLSRDAKRSERRESPKAKSSGKKTRYSRVPPNYIYIYIYTSNLTYLIGVDICPSPCVPHCLAVCPLGLQGRPKTHHVGNQPRCLGRSLHPRSHGTLPRRMVPLPR